MFLWIRLLYDHLSPGKSTKQLQRVILETPAGLEQTYKRGLKASPSFQTMKETAYSPFYNECSFDADHLGTRAYRGLLVDIDDMSDSFPKDDLPDAWNDFYANETIRKPCR